MNRVSAYPALALILSALVSACGPSVQSIYEGNVRFEHCYRLDLDPAIAPPHRDACWTDWLSVYTYGQTTDRVEYAQRRLAELKSSNESVVLNVDSALEATAPAAPAEVAAPINVHRPPPPTAGAVRSLAEAAAPPPDEPPSLRCTRQCEGVWRSCQASCPTGTQVPLCANCAMVYRSCVQRCFN